MKRPRLIILNFLFRAHWYLVASIAKLRKETEYFYRKLWTGAAFQRNKYLMRLALTIRLHALQEHSNFIELAPKSPINAVQRGSSRIITSTGVGSGVNKHLDNLQVAVFCGIVQRCLAKSVFKCYIGTARKIQLHILCVALFCSLNQVGFIVWTEAFFFG